jgi:D-inositol-3-phosphate glycosyltransferase
MTPRVGRRLRILMVSHYYPPHLGGIENVARGEAVRLAAAGHDVTVVTSTTGGVRGTSWDDGVRVQRVATWNGIEERTGVPFPVVGPGLVFLLGRLIRRADVVHVHDSLYVTSWVAAFWARVLRRPMILTQHVELIEHPSGLVRAVQRAVYRSSGRLVLRTARRVAVLNGRVAEFVAAAGVRAERISLLPNGVDTDRFRPPGSGERAAARASFDLPPAAFVVLFVGRFVPKKGFDLLLQATAAGPNLLVLAGGRWPVALPGDGQDHGRRCLGALTPPRLAELYRAADLFVLPSEGEGFPLTAQEAMASGLPVVLGDDLGYACYDLDRDLVRFVGRSAGAIRAVIDELSDDAGRRAAMGAYSVTTATARFGWVAHLAALTDLYRAAAVRPAGDPVRPAADPFRPVADPVPPADPVRSR